jgi:hypothetical protein
MDPLTKLIQRLSAVCNMIEGMGIHELETDKAQNLWGLQSGGFYVPSASDSDGEPITFMFKPGYPTTISMTQSVYNELSHDNDGRVKEGLDPMITYLERCRDANGVRLEHMSETVSTYLTVHDIFLRGTGNMTVFKYNKSVTSPPSILRSAGASKVAVDIPPFFVLDQGVSVYTAKEAIGITDRTICNCLSKVFDSGNPIDFSVKSTNENPNNSIMHPDTFGRMGCIFTFKSYSFDEKGRQLSITNNTVLVIGFKNENEGYALVYLKSGSNAPVIFTTTNFRLTVENLSNKASVIIDVYGNTLNLFHTFDIGVRRFLKLLCDFSYRSYSAVCKIVKLLEVKINVPCYITKDVQSSVGHDQIIYSSNIHQLNGELIVIPMGFVSSSSTSAPATIDKLAKVSTSRAIPLTTSINTTAKYTNIAAEVYGDNFVVCAIYLERIDPRQPRQADNKSILISQLRDELQALASKLYNLSLTDDIFESLKNEITKLENIAFTERQSLRRPTQDSLNISKATSDAIYTLNRANEAMKESLPELADIAEKYCSKIYERLLQINHISQLSKDQQSEQKIIVQGMKEIIGMLRSRLFLEFDPLYNKWVNGMSKLQVFISISEDSSEDDIKTSIAKLTSESSTGKRKRQPELGGSHLKKSKRNTKRIRKTRKITKRYKNATTKRRL